MKGSDKKGGKGKKGHGKGKYGKRNDKFGAKNEYGKGYEQGKDKEKKGKGKGSRKEERPPPNSSFPSFVANGAIRRMSAGKGMYKEWRSFRVLPLARRRGARGPREDGSWHSRDR